MLYNIVLCNIFILLIILSIIHTIYYIIYVKCKIHEMYICITFNICNKSNVYNISSIISNDESPSSTQSIFPHYNLPLFIHD